MSVLRACASGPLGGEVERCCARLGADVRTWTEGAGDVGAGDAGAGDAGAGGAGAGGAGADAAARADILCYDGDATFAAAAGDRDALDVCLEQAWEVTRELIAAPLLDAQVAAADGAAAATDTTRGAHPSRVVFIAPRARSGAFADAARAGLENLARTLSIEWARHGVSTVVIAPGEETAATDVAALVAYLSSAAGGYFSGCLFDLRGPSVSLRP